MTAIRVYHTIDRFSICASPWEDVSWRAFVVSNAESEIRDVLRKAYPDAELDVRVYAGSRSITRVEGDFPENDYDRIVQLVEDASEYAFDKSCKMGGPPATGYDE
jgi:hypothetical protein